MKRKPSWRKQMKDCKLCQAYIVNGKCYGDENGRVDQTGELKCFRIKNKLLPADIESKIKDKKFTVLWNERP